MRFDDRSERVCPVSPDLSRLGLPDKPVLTGMGGVVSLVEQEWVLGDDGLAVEMSGFSKDRCLSTSTVAMAMLWKREKMCVSETGSLGIVYT